MEDNDEQREEVYDAGRRGVRSQRVCARAYVARDARAREDSRADARGGKTPRRRKRSAEQVDRFEALTQEQDDAC